MMFMGKVVLAKVKKPYFLGIGGIGISAIARMFLGEGKKVHGSDLNDSEIVAELRKAGAEITVGQSIDLIPKDADLIVYSIAIEKYEPKLLAEARKRGVPVLSYPEILGIVSKDKFTIAVSGTHGKTTTTAMIAKILIDAGLDPTVIVGSLLKNSDLKKARSNFIAGKSKYLVVEACEYQRSFLNINPTIAVVTNVDNDHLDYYKDIPDIARAFGEFVAKVPKRGYVVTNAKDKNIKMAIKNATQKIVDYGEFRQQGIKLKLPGTHNKENAAAALAVAHLLEIDKNRALKSLEEFVGTWRRFEYKGKTGVGALVYDDYGHHPTEIRATLAGARELYPKARIVVVFQPHLFSRTKLLLDDFARAFSDADQVLLAPIYAAREAFDQTISSAVLAKRLERLGKKQVSAFSELAAIEKSLRKELKKDDVLITMGAGEANKIADTLVEK